MPTKKRPLSILSLYIILGIVTSLITSSLITRAQQVSPRKKAKPQVVQGSRALTKTTTHVLASQDTIPSAQPSRATIASVAIASLTLKVDGSDVEINSVADIYDTRPNVQYVWMLRVAMRDLNGTILHQNLYKNHVFGTNSSNRSSQNFIDHIKLPSALGQYRVEVAIYEFAPTFNINTIVDLSSIKNNELCHFRRDIN